MFVLVITAAVAGFKPQCLSWESWEKRYINMQKCQIHTQSPRDPFVVVTTYSARLPVQKIIGITPEGFWSSL